MTNIKAIETHYKGYRFRSRLEARWAVFFDTQGITWEYEKEGFDLGEVGLYLPDYWLPQVEMWAEVKPSVFSYEEIKKCVALWDMTKRPVIMLEGVPDYRSYYVCSAMHWDEYEDRLMSKEGDIATQTDGGYPGGDYDVCISFCDVVIDSTYLSENRLFWCAGHGNYPEVNFLPPSCGLGDLKKAVKAARSARFEHGESG